MKARFLYSTSEEGALRLSIHVESDTVEEAALIRVFRSQGPHQLPDVYLAGLGSGPHEHPEGVREQNLTFAVREPPKPREPLPDLAVVSNEETMCADLHALEVAAAEPAKSEPASAALSDEQLVATYTRRGFNFGLNTQHAKGLRDVAEAATVAYRARLTSEGAVEAVRDHVYARWGKWPDKESALALLTAAIAHADGAGETVAKEEPRVEPWHGKKAPT